jgi:hypothetical protein
MLAKLGASLDIGEIKSGEIKYWRIDFVFQIFS